MLKHSIDIALKNTYTQYAAQHKQNYDTLLGFLR